MNGFDYLFSKLNWQPIKNCPGRYILKAASRELKISEFVGDDVVVSEYNLAATRDLVLVATIPGGGIISYQRSGGSYVHTLCNTSGFHRKLDQLGIEHST